MRITTQDINSLHFCIVLLGNLKEQTITDKQRRNLEIHQHRVRKCYLILLNCSQDRYFDFEKACISGVPDNSVVAKGIRVLTPKSEDDLELD